jgi:antitoxin YefM
LNILYVTLYVYLYKIIMDMITATISDFRKDIRKYLDRVIDNFETLIINRGKDNSVVIMSLDEYNSLCATYHELSSKTNEKRLDAAIEKMKNDSSFQKELIEK